MATDAPRYVLLDRDGTIIRERHYLSDPGLVELLPGAVEGMRLLLEAGLRLVVVTNQSGVGRGYFSEDTLERIHDRLQEMLTAAGIELGGIYVCPHTPDDDCGCRKPRTGMVDRASRELGFDPGRAFVIGDNASDIELGRRIGASTYLVRTGHGSGIADTGASVPDHHVAADLAEAARILVASLD